MSQWWLKVKIMTIAVMAFAITALSSCDRAYAAQTSDYYWENWLWPNDVYTPDEMLGLRRWNEVIDRAVNEYGARYFYVFAGTSSESGKRLPYLLFSEEPVEFHYRSEGHEYLVYVDVESQAEVRYVNFQWSDSYVIARYQNGTFMVNVLLWSEVQNINTPEEIGRTNVVLENITSTSVDVVVRNISKPYDKMIVRVFHLDEEHIGESTGERVRISGLKPGTYYNVHVWLEYGGLRGDTTILDFWTRKDKYDFWVQTASSGRQISFNSTNYVYPLEDLVIGFTDYSKIDVYADGYMIREHMAGSGNEAITIGKEEFEQYLDDQKVNFEIRAYKGNQYDKYEFQIDSSIDPTKPIQPGDGGSSLEPRPPEPPDSSWDIVGWIKYIVGWIVYLVETIVWLLRRLGDLIRSLMNNVSGLGSVLSSFFGFLPKELVALLSLGVVVSILLRVFKR